MQELELQQRLHDRKEWLQKNGRKSPQPTKLNAPPPVKTNLSTEEEKYQSFEKRQISTNGYAHISPRASDKSPQSKLPTSSPSAATSSPQTTSSPPETLWVVGKTGAMVRGAREIKSRQVACLPPGTMVTVAETWGRRVRLISPVRGWCSRENEIGYHILSKTPPAIPPASTPRRKVLTMSSAQLKDVIVANGLSYGDCKTITELQERAYRAYLLEATRKTAASNPLDTGQPPPPPLPPESNGHKRWTPSINPPTSRKKRRPEPTAFRVSESGSEVVNGIYRRNGINDGIAQYTLDRDGKTFDLFRDIDETQIKCWWIVRVDESDDVEFYVNRNDQNYPPCGGWQRCSGREPVPRVDIWDRETDSDDENGIDEMKIDHIGNYKPPGNNGRSSSDQGSSSASPSKEELINGKGSPITTTPMTGVTKSKPESAFSKPKKIERPTWVPEDHKPKKKSPLADEHKEILASTKMEVRAGYDVLDKVTGLMNNLPPAPVPPKIKDVLMDDVMTSTEHDDSSRLFYKSKRTDYLRPAPVSSNPSPVTFNIRGKQSTPSSITSSSISPSSKRSSNPPLPKLPTTANSTTSSGYKPGLSASSVGYHPGPPTILSSTLNKDRNPIPSPTSSNGIKPFASMRSSYSASARREPSPDFFPHHCRLTNRTGRLCCAECGKPPIPSSIPIGLMLSYLNFPVREERKELEPPQRDKRRDRDEQKERERRGLSRVASVGSSSLASSRRRDRDRGSATVVNHLWQWRNSDGSWRDYPSHVRIRLEQLHSHSSSAKSYRFMTGGHEFEVNVDSMTQSNVRKFGHTRRVRRIRKKPPHRDSLSGVSVPGLTSEQQASQPSVLDDHQMALELHRQLNDNAENEDYKEMSPLSQLAQSLNRPPENSRTPPRPPRANSPGGLGDIFSRLQSESSTDRMLEQLERQRSLEQQQQNSQIDFMLAMRLASENYDDDDEFGAGPYYDSDFDEDLGMDDLLGMDVDNMTYEELLELGDQIGQVKQKGITEEQLALLKLQTISKREDIPDVEKCVICLEEFKLADVIRPLPCTHAFHCKCIDRALKIKNECPICRRNPSGESPKVKPKR